MAKNNNLNDFLTDIANSIRTKTGTTELINAQDFSDKILSIPNTLKRLLDATKSCQHLFEGYKGTSVDDLIQPNDTENVTNMDSMFYGCSGLTTVPLLNTSNVTNMHNMFYGCSGLTTIPLLDTSNVTAMNYLFGSCSHLTTIPLLDTSKVINMQYMFISCGRLTTIPAINVNSVGITQGMLIGCSNLKSILMTNIGANLDISVSTKFEREDLLVILNNLKTVTLTKTLKMGATNLAKLTEEDKAIATNKGWTLA